MFLLNLQKRKKSPEDGIHRQTTPPQKKPHREDVPGALYQENRLKNPNTSAVRWCSLVAILYSTSRRCGGGGGEMTAGVCFEKQCCQPKICGEVRRRRKEKDWRPQVSRPMCPAAVTNRNASPLSGRVNILRDMTIILQRGYLGSTDRRCKHTIEKTGHLRVHLKVTSL